MASALIRCVQRVSLLLCFLTSQRNSAKIANLPILTGNVPAIAHSPTLFLAKALAQGGSQGLDFPPEHTREPPLGDVGCPSADTRAEAWLGMSKDQHLFSGDVLGGDPSSTLPPKPSLPNTPSHLPHPPGRGTKDAAGLLPGQSRRGKPVLGDNDITAIILPQFRPCVPWCHREIGDRIIVNQYN